ncbi:hypothetical protein EAS64_01745 [Trebonia kvetii]|uniref:Uncharacterized protein n=1 Tax=Trebonia kvetii TaxID=2480626 RepID=A0A6P2C4U4_9ACTN|nr:hypothetical protein EAS64_01745 [Trebonia kvetii]
MVEFDEEAALRRHRSPAARGQGPRKAGGRANAGLQGQRPRPAGREQAERPALQPAGQAGRGGVPGSARERRGQEGGERAVRPAPAGAGQEGRGERAQGDARPFQRRLEQR